jgi:hypothetical protein
VGLKESGPALPEGYAAPPYGDFGHYPWAVEFSKHQARIISTGFGTLTAYQWRPLQPYDPPFDKLADVNFDRGAY